MNWTHIDALFFWLAFFSTLLIVGSWLTLAIRAIHRRWRDLWAMDFPETQHPATLREDDTL